MASMSANLLTTLPEDDSGMQFHQTDYPSKWEESYRPGGFHPINLGGSFKIGQYCVIRKLGYGSFSTVWLARDKMSVTIDDTISQRIPDAKLPLQESQLRSIEHGGWQIIPQK